MSAANDASHWPGRICQATIPSFRNPVAFKPLLAAAEAGEVRFPVLATPKIDGIRCLVTDKGAVTRSLKPIPNNHVRETLNALGIEGHDGELFTFADGVRDDFNTVQSKVMRREGAPDFRFIVFDTFADPTAPYSARVEDIVERGPVEALRPTRIADRAALDCYERTCVDTLGWEGVMIRDPRGPYKMGRSTAKEGILVKIKRFTDDEAVITGSVERMHNANAASVNALGHIERSSAKAGLVGADTLGALQCLWNGVAFEIGTGFTEDQRAALWDQRDRLAGQSVTFRFQGTGTHGAPRFPVFVGIRRDM